MKVKVAFQENQTKLNAQFQENNENLDFEFENHIVIDDGNGKIYMRVHDAYIQYSDDKATWYNLVSLSELKGDPGSPGADGNDGIAPHVGENGNWFVGETDTGVKAQGDVSVSVDPTLSVEGMPADAKAVGTKLGSRAHTTQILYRAPNATTEGYTGQMAFDKSGRKLYVCTDGIIETEYGDFGSNWFTWEQLSEYKFVNSAPTRDTYATYGEIWVNFSEPAIYICEGPSWMEGGAPPAPDYDTYIQWKRIAGLPEFTEEDEGKTLQIENGVMVWKRGSDVPESGESSSPSAPAPDIDTESIYMRVYNDYIQYSEDNETWHDIIALSELKGEPGRTPEKGVDYWTESDKSEIVADVLSALPTWEGGNY